MTPDDLKAFQDRQEQQERPIIAAFLAWIARVRARLPVSVVAKALTTGDWQPVLVAVREAGPFSPDLLTPAAAEAVVAMGEVPDLHGLKLSFDLQDPYFAVAVHDLGAQAIVEIDSETRAAVQQIITNARRDGLHPRQFAPQIRDLVGLTMRQSGAVEKRLKGMLDEGVPPERAQREADRYGAKMLRLRGMTIARTETVKAASAGRLASFNQAARNGLLDPSRTYMEWMSVQDDSSEICFQLNGERWLMDDPNMEVPPQHPNCRCALFPVIV